MDAIDWNAVNWLVVIILSVIAFLAAFFANFVNLIFDNNPISGALLTACLFAGLYIGWTYYPHGIDVGQNNLPAAESTYEGVEQQ